MLRLDVRRALSQLSLKHICWEWASLKTPHWHHPQILGTQGRVGLAVAFCVRFLTLASNAREKDVQYEIKKYPTPMYSTRKRYDVLKSANGPVSKPPKSKYRGVHFFYNRIYHTKVTSEPHCIS